MIDAILDLSHWQGTGIDFARAKAAGIVAVILKATQGQTTDKDYLLNAEAARAHGLLDGAYCFGIDSDGNTEAEYFLELTAPGPQTVTALDFEHSPLKGTDMHLNEAEDWVRTVRNQTGRWPLIYGSDYLREIAAGNPNSILTLCPLWIAEYGPVIHVPPQWTDWTLWQHSQTGTVDGVPGNVDRSYFNGDVHALMTFWGVEPDAMP